MIECFIVLAVMFALSVAGVGLIALEIAAFVILAKLEARQDAGR